jgi:hypothetical protein
VAAEDIYGYVFDADLLEDQVRILMELWFHTELLEIERLRGMTPNTLERPKSYHVAETVDAGIGEQLPAIVIVSPGLARPPVHEGDGNYRATWSLAVGAIVAAGGDNPRANTNRLLRRYIGAARAILLNHPEVFNIPGHDQYKDMHEVFGIDWIDESFDRLDYESGETIAAGEALFEIEVTNAVKGGGGPRNPVEPDPGTVGTQWPVATTTKVIMEDPVPITEEVS